MNPREWSPPQGLIIQPGAILVPGRVGYVPDAVSWPERFDVKGPHLRTPWSDPGRPVPADEGDIANIQPVSVPRWDLSSLTEAELDSLQVAIEAQRQRHRPALPRYRGGP